MAEWALLIMVCSVVGGAYWLNRRFFETWQIVAIWCGAGLILVVGLIWYISAKVDRATGGFEDRYQIEDR